MARLSRRLGARLARLSLGALTALALPIVVVWTHAALASEMLFSANDGSTSSSRAPRKDFMLASLRSRPPWTDATFEDARTCYGNSTSWFDSYTLLEALPREATRTIVRNTLRWTTAHGSRLCIWNVRGDRSRKSSWSKIIAVLEGLACSKARWAMWFDADAVIQNADISPTKVLAEIERHLGADRFANVDIVFSSEFGDLKEKGNPINAGVFFVRVNERSVRFFTRVWNDFHAISLLNRPEHLEQDALWYFYEREREEFDRHAAVVPFQIFNNPNGKSNDFIRHYAGGGRGHGAARKTDKFVRLAAELSATLGSDQDAPLPDDVYAVRSRFVSSWPPKMFFRLFPTKVTARECTAHALRAGEVVSVRG
jgi:hypothetical protein